MILNVIENGVPHVRKDSFASLEQLESSLLDMFSFSRMNVHLFRNERKIVCAHPDGRVFLVYEHLKP